MRNNLPTIGNVEIEVRRELQNYHLKLVRNISESQNNLPCNMKSDDSNLKNDMIN